MQNKILQLTIAALTFLAFYAPAGAADSKIYRTVDEDGNVVFTDIAPRVNQPSEAVNLPNTNSFDVEEVLGPRAEWVVDGAGTALPADDSAVVAYGSLQILTPGNDEAVRDNSGNISIVAVLTPDLHAGHRLRVLLDGTPVTEGSESTFLLENVDRGTHAVTAEVVDQSGSVLIKSSATTFHLLRYAGGR